jgi:hypothetical protein
MTRLCENVKSREARRVRFSDAAAPQFNMLLTLPEQASEGMLFSAICAALRFYTAKTHNRH